MAMDRNPAQGFGALAPDDWATDESYWREHWQMRPYVTASRGFDFYHPAYHYGHTAAGTHRGRSWDEVEGELRTGWDRYEHRGQSRWEDVKDAVRDAWHRAVRH